jgi:hypothetical protein
MVGQEIHLALSWNGSSARAFIDGRSVPAKEHTFDASKWRGGAPLHDMILGADILGPLPSGVPSRHFQGRLREVRLSQGERYDADFSPADRHAADDDTVVLYHCNEGEGDILHDSSPHMHDGRIVGGKWGGIPAVSADRRAAVWALSLGGSVAVRKPGETALRTLSTAELPADEFELVELALSTPAAASRVTDDSLRHVRGLPALKVLNLLGCKKLSDAGIAQLADLPSLESITLTFVPVTDTSIPVLLQFRTLKTVQLGETLTGDASVEKLCRGLAELQFLEIGRNTTEGSLAHVAHAAKLRSFGGLRELHLSDTGLRHLQGAPRIVYVSFAHAQDKDVASIVKIKHLRGAGLSYCEATPDGLRALAELPKLDSLWLADSPRVGDQHLTVLSELKGVKVLYLRRSAVTDAGMTALADMADLRELTLSKTDVGDGAVPHLSRLASLRKLLLDETKITAAAVAQLHEALPKCEITWDGGTVPPSSPR